MHVLTCACASPVNPSFIWSTIALGPRFHTTTLILRLRWCGSPMGAVRAMCRAHRAGQAIRRNGPSSGRRPRYQTRTAGVSPSPGMWCASCIVRLCQLSSSSVQPSHRFLTVASGKPKSAPRRSTSIEMAWSTVRNPRHVGHVCVWKRPGGYQERYLINGRNARSLAASG